MKVFREIMNQFKVNVLLLVGLYIYFVLHLVQHLPKEAEMAALVFGLAGVVVGIGASAAKDLLAPPPPVEVPIELAKEIAETNRLLAIDNEVLLARYAAEEAQAKARIAELAS